MVSVLRFRAAIAALRQVLVGFRVGGLDWLGLLSRFGDDLLSHVLRRSTIGATALNCRVRDGIGCFPAAMITKPGKRARFSSGFQVKSLTEVLGMYGFRSRKSCFHWIGSSLSDH